MYPAKFRNTGITFYSESKFYNDIGDVFVAPFPRHLMFNDRLRNVDVDISYP